MIKILDPVHLVIRPAYANPSYLKRPDYNLVLSGTYYRWPDMMPLPEIWRIVLQ